MGGMEWEDAGQVTDVLLTHLREAVGQQQTSRGDIRHGHHRETERERDTEEADPELEKLLDEEEAIAKRTAQGEGHETPHFRGED